MRSVICARLALCALSIGLLANSDLEEKPLFLEAYHGSETFMTAYRMAGMLGQPPSQFSLEFNLINNQWQIEFSLGDERHVKLIIDPQQYNLIPREATISSLNDSSEVNLSIPYGDDMVSCFQNGEVVYATINVRYINGIPTEIINSRFINCDIAHEQIELSSRDGVYILDSASR